ncbi:MAG: acyl-CoA thioesterase [Flavobacteriales bacterium]
MYSSDTKLRVRYGETDRMGYAYYGNYAEYIEVGRVEALRELGYSYRELEDSGVLLPVLEYWSKFIKPAGYDDLLTVWTMIHEVPETRFPFDYEVLNEQGELLTKARTTLVFVDKDSGRPCQCPEELQASIKKALEA